MKFPSYNLAGIITAIKEGKLKALLIYGQDHGLISFCFQEIVKSLKLEVRSLDYKDLGSGELEQYLNNIGLFASKEIVRLSHAPHSVDSKFKALCQANNHHLLIITAEELLPQSSLRKLFETEASLGAMPCYYDDKQSVGKIVRQQLSITKQQIDQGALEYLGNNLTGDRYIILNELEKLLCYTHGKTTISLADVEQVISQATNAEPDELCIAFASNNLKLFWSELEKLLADNIAIIWVIRALIRYYINLYIVKQKTVDGMSLNDAVSSLSPPIFFKYSEAFRAIAAKKTLPEILSGLEALYQAEMTAKSATQSPEQLAIKLYCDAKSAK